MPTPDPRSVTQKPQSRGRGFRCTLRCGDRVATLGNPIAIAEIMDRAKARIIRRSGLTFAIRDKS